MSLDPESILRKLLDCAAREVDVHAQGLEVSKSYIDRCLVNRLRMVQDIKRHPEARDGPAPRRCATTPCPS